MKPFFSVVIPTYNRSEKLKQTIKSVLVQTFNDFEVLVMDDGSTDNTGSIVRTFNDNRIKYDWTDNSGGPATPRNRGIDLAIADWICFLDADDIWYPNKLKIIADEIKTNSKFEVYCHYEQMYLLKQGKKKLLKYGPFEKKFYQRMLLEGNRLSTSATTVSRSFLNRHSLRFNQSPEYVIVEDYDLWLRIALLGGRFCFINSPLGEYIIEDGNISSDETKFYQNQKELLNDHVFKIQKFDLNKDRVWNKIKARILISASKKMISQKKYISGAKSFIHGFNSSFSGALFFLFSKIRKFLKNLIF